MKPAVNRNAVLSALYGKGMNLKKWCAEEGFDYVAASNVLRGSSPALRGKAREIAQKLNALTQVAA